MTLKEAAPYFPVVKIRPNHTELHEELDRDPSEMTIGELHKHRFYLETEILKTGPDTCTICRIVIGSVMIIWQVHVNHVYQAYSMLKKPHLQLSLQAIHFMSIPEIEKWEGLPFLWNGQDVAIGEIGPIETSTCVRHEPYLLPQGFEWSILDSSNFDDIIQLYEDSDPICSMSRNFLQWVISSPVFKKGCLLGIRSSLSKKLVWVAISLPCKIKIGRKILSVVHLHFASPDAEHYRCFHNIGTKETMRILKYERIYQATMITKQRVIPKSVIIQDVYFCDLRSHSLPYTTPRTVGLRRMKQTDVPKALAFTNQYTSQFEIGRIFQSEEEFSHWFLNPLHTTTYVVEEPNSGNITDMFSFTTGVANGIKVATVPALVITTSSKQLITDLLVFIKDQNITLVSLFQYGLKEHLFTDFTKSSELTDHQFHWLFYNYRYPETDNHCLFVHNYMM